MISIDRTNGVMAAKVASVLFAGFLLGAGVPMMLMTSGGDAPAGDAATEAPDVEAPAKSAPRRSTDPRPAPPPAKKAPAKKAPATGAANTGDPNDSTPAARVEVLTEKAVDAWLDGDGAAAMRWSRSALGLVDEMKDASRAAVLRVRLGKVVARVRAAKKGAPTGAATPPPVRPAGGTGDDPEAGKAGASDKKPRARTTSRLWGAVALSSNNGGDLVRLAGVNVSVLRSRLAPAVTTPLREDVLAIVNGEQEALSKAIETFTRKAKAPASSARALERLRAQLRQLADENVSVDGLFSGLHAARASLVERIALDPARRDVGAVVRRRIDNVASTIVVQARMLEVTTDQVGGYDFPELAAGSYLVHVASVTKRWHVEWLGVFDAATPADYRFDLSNENARWLQVHE